VIGVRIEWRLIFISGVLEGALASIGTYRSLLNRKEGTDPRYQSLGYILRETHYLTRFPEPQLSSEKRQTANSCSWPPPFATPKTRGFLKSTVQRLFTCPEAPTVIFIDLERQNDLARLRPGEL
jgi:hypothetical protein